jgi:uncharacterized cupredoxin-like copper-binding protein
VEVLALTGKEIGMAAIALAFVAFALVSAMLVPRYRPDFPGRNGVGIFVLASVVFFLGTMAGVLVLGKEDEEEAHAETRATTAPGEVTEEIDVAGTEYRFEFEKVELRPGTYVFRFKNEGSAAHNLTVDSHNVEGETPTIEAGAEANLEVALQEPGEYEFFCSVPGHEDAGMVTQITVQ